LITNLKDREQLVLENLALRHRIQVLKRRKKRPNLRTCDRLLWVSLKRLWPNWKTALVMVQPETVIGWQRTAFRAFWRWKSRVKNGHPSTDPELIALIRHLGQANPTWGRIRIRGELAKVGLRVSDSTIRKYRPKSPPRPSQTWRSLLHHPLYEIAAMDFFVVPTATFHVLQVLVVMAHERRKVVHCNVTESPTAAWTAQQIVNAFPETTAPRFLLHDRDGIYGAEVAHRIQGLGIEQKLIAPSSPGQNPFVGRLMGSIRRECLDHVIILNETHLRRVLSGFLGYDHKDRPRRSLDHDPPMPRAVEPPEAGPIIELPMVGGLHHRYARRAA